MAAELTPVSSVGSYSLSPESRKANTDDAQSPAKVAQSVLADQKPATGQKPPRHDRVVEKWRDRYCAADEEIETPKFTSGPEYSTEENLDKYFQRGAYLQVPRYETSAASASSSSSSSPSLPGSEQRMDRIARIVGGKLRKTSLELGAKRCKTDEERVEKAYNCLEDGCIEDACTYVRSIMSTDLRRRVCGDICRKLVRPRCEQNTFGNTFTPPEESDIEAAIALALDELTDSFHRSHVMESIVSALLSRDRIEKALHLIFTYIDVEADSFRDAVTNACTTLAGNGRLEKAVDVVSRARDETGDSDAFLYHVKEICESGAQSGYVDEALQCAERLIGHEELYNEAKSVICEELARCHREDEANALAVTMTEPSSMGVDPLQHVSIIIGIARGGDPVRAYYLASELEYAEDFDEAMRVIPVEIAKKGNIDLALAVIKEKIAEDEAALTGSTLSSYAADNGFRHQNDNALRGVCIQALRAGRIDLAQEGARHITNIYIRDGVISTTARTLADQGDDVAARIVAGSIYSTTTREYVGEYINSRWKEA